MVELYVFWGNFEFFRWGKITPSKKGAGKITTPSYGVIVSILSDIITLARCVILQSAKLYNTHFTLFCV